MMEYRKWEKGLLREDGKPGFETPTGKFEIASTLLEEYGYDPLPRYVEPTESPASRPDLAARHPLVFNSGAHHNADLHSLHHSIPGLGKECGRRPWRSTAKTLQAGHSRRGEGRPAHLPRPR